MSFHTQTPAGLVLAVKAQPGARRVQIGPVVAAAPQPGWPPARLKVAVNAAPEDGKANEAIIAALCHWLGVKRDAVTLTAGASAREKKFLIQGAPAIPEP
ncbi:DUF167 domain-containing protein [Acidocella sp.]|uniref:DUF167 domain-containing protein n=1 Tax=Acidocella sp. TaxID=50710 RepID=UPI00262BE2A1|nr:DUF167 domain-containing protein [Acidocella sp.]